MGLVKIILEDAGLGLLKIGLWWCFSYWRAIARNQLRAY